MKIWDWSRSHIVALLLVLVCGLLMGSAVLAQGAVSQPTNDPSELLKLFQTTISSGQWPMALGVVIWFLITLARKLEGIWKDQPWAKTYAPLIAFALALLTPLAAGLIAGQGVVSLAFSVASGLLAWATAMGSNEIVNALKSAFAWLKKDPAPKVAAATKPVMAAAYKTGSINLAELKGAGLKVYGSDGKLL